MEQINRRIAGDLKTLGKPPRWRNRVQVLQDIDRRQLRLELPPSLDQLEEDPEGAEATVVDDRLEAA